MIILNQDVEHKGMRIQPLQGSTAINDLSENNPKMFKDALDLMEFCDKDRFQVFPLGLVIATGNFPLNLLHIFVQVFMVPWLEKESECFFVEPGAWQHFWIKLSGS